MDMIEDLLAHPGPNARQPPLQLVHLRVNKRP